MNGSGQSMIYESNLPFLFITTSGENSISIDLEKLGGVDGSIVFL